MIDEAVNMSMRDVLEFSLVRGYDFVPTDTKQQRSDSMRRIPTYHLVNQAEKWKAAEQSRSHGKD